MCQLRTGSYMQPTVPVCVQTKQLPRTVPKTACTDCMCEWELLYKKINLIHACSLQRTHTTVTRA